MTDFINKPAVAWATVNLQTSINADLDSGAANKIIAIAGILIIPLSFILFGAYGYLQNGDLMTLKRGLACGGVFIVFFLVLLALLLPTRFKTAKLIDATGVLARSGKKHNWQDLYYINYKYLRNNRGKYLNHYELVFSSGKVVFPPLLILDNGADVNTFVQSIPAQIRDDGIIRQ